MFIMLILCNHAVNTYKLPSLVVGMISLLNGEKLNVCPIDPDLHLHLEHPHLPLHSPLNSFGYWTLNKYYYYYYYIWNW